MSTKNTSPIKRIISHAIKLLVFILLLAFAWQNQQQASLNFPLETTWRAPMMLIMLAIYILGLATGILCALPTILKLKKQTKKQDQETQDPAQKAKSEEQQQNNTQQTNGI